MMKAPPLLPSEVVARVQRLARFDGLSVALVAGSLALVAAILGDYVGAGVGLLVAGAGAVELHGASLLTQRHARGMSWLVRSQLLLLTAILAYCALRWARPDLAPLRRVVSDDMKEQLELIGWSVDAFLQLVYRLTYVCVALVTTLYQGGMALYYWRRSAAVAAALESER
jgi:hypothetical protein